MKKVQNHDVDDEVEILESFDLDLQMLKDLKKIQMPKKSIQQFHVALVENYHY